MFARGSRGGFQRDLNAPLRLDASANFLGFKGLGSRGAIETQGSAPHTTNSVDLPSSWRLGSRFSSCGSAGFKI